MNKYEIIDVKTGKDYSSYLPNVDNTIDVEANFQDVIIAENYLPLEHVNDLELPATNKHIIGIRKQGILKKVQMSYSYQKWQSFGDGDSHKPMMSIGAAGDNAVSSRWFSEDAVGPISNITVHICPRKLQQVARETLGLDDSLVELNHKAGVYDPLIHHLVYAMNQYSGDDFCSLYVEQSLQMLCVHILTHYCTFSKPIKQYKKGLSNIAFKRATEYIKENFNQVITIDELAALCNMSSFHFSRLFKKSTGMSPRQYILSIRVQSAKDLLKNTGLRVEQVGLMVGYSNSNNFSRMFVKHTGFSPLQFRALNN